MSERYRSMLVQVGKYLQKKRSDAGLTQFDVARKLGYISAQYISNIERGIVLPPNKSIRKLMALYGIPQDEFFELLLKAQTILLKDAVYKRSVGRR